MNGTGPSAMVVEKDVVEMEANRGALRLHNVESSREVPRGAHQVAVIKVPGVQGERGYLSPDTLDDWVES